uniref:ribosomal protein S23 n=1 Tax=Phacus arnoldii TaxID=298292 RepID=UPI0023AB0EAD|nr:ribosomal protein S23 [Phacus arnoldii]WCH63574.1 ribosomal protein S23 [Phacus arnoldii]
MKYPIFTDKTNKLLQKNKYTFLVDTSTKLVAKKTIEEVFNVKVLSINSSILSIKKRRIGKFNGYRNIYKRIIFTLFCL